MCIVAAIQVAATLSSARANIRNTTINTCQNNIPGKISCKKTTSTITKKAKYEAHAWQVLLSENGGSSKHKIPAKTTSIP